MDHKNILLKRQNLFLKSFVITRTTISGKDRDFNYSPLQ